MELLEAGRITEQANKSEVITKLAKEYYTRARRNAKLHKGKVYH